MEWKQRLMYRNYRFLHTAVENGMVSLKSVTFKKCVKIMQITERDVFIPCLWLYIVYVDTDSITYNPLNAVVECRRQDEVFQLFLKILTNFNFHSHIWIQHVKCIQMSTNKPSIGAVVHEISPCIIRYVFKFFTSGTG